MAAWVLGLSLGAGYLFNTTSLLRLKTPSSNGVTSAEIRGLRGDTRFVKYGDMSEELPTAQIEKEQQRLEQQAREFDAGAAPVPPLKGAWLSSERDFC